LKFAFTLCFVLVLSGCESDADFWRPYQLLTGTVASPVPQEVQTTSKDPHCDSVARQRASDAIANGFDTSLAELIYRGTYSDCVAWNEAHPSSR
jgi:hypothetical protein